jgi:hypothetical protein
MICYLDFWRLMSVDLECRSGDRMSAYPSLLKMLKSDPCPCSDHHFDTASALLLGPYTSHHTARAVTALHNVQYIT